MQIKIGKFEVNLSSRKSEQRSASLTDWNGWLSFFGMDANSSDEVVTESTAMRISTVNTCLKILGEDIAALPRSIMQRKENTREKVKNSRLNYLLNTRPNRHMTSFNWTFAMIAGAAGWGQSYAPIVRDKYHDIDSFELLSPWDVTTVAMPDGSRYYRCISTGKVYNPDDVLTLRPFTLNGKDPVSIIRYNTETLGFAQKANKFRGKVFNVKPPGYLSSDGPIKDDQLKAIGDQWKVQVNGAGTPVLYSGLKYHPLSFSPSDLQLLEATASTKEDICGMFRMPPVFVQNYKNATFANAEQQDLVYGKYTLLPFVTNFEQEIDGKCFSEQNALSDTPYYSNFNLKGLLQADIKTRSESLRVMWQTGAISANTWLAMEDMNPVEGGDKLYIPMNMISTDKAPEFYDKLISVGSNAKQTAGEGRDMSAEQRDFFDKISALVKMNGYNHHENA